MSISATVLVNIGITGRVNSSNILKPLHLIPTVVQIVEQTFLSQIFQNNISAANRFICCFNCTVFTTGPAIFFNESIVTVVTLPKYIMWPKL